MPRQRKIPFHVFDSELKEEYPKQSWPAMAYEPIWQSLRVSCVGMWGQLATMRLCCARLEIYMHRGVDKEVRTWRALNLLRSVPYNRLTAIGVHVIESDAVDFLLAYTDVIRKAYALMEEPREWDWATARHGLQILWRRKPEWTLHLFHALKNGRSRNRMKPELFHYLLMCAEVMSTDPQKGD